MSAERGRVTEFEVEASPVTKVARDLTEIVNLHRKLLTQAVHDANSRLIPGGHAMVALGNVANLEAWENLEQATELHLAGVDGYRRAYTSVEDEDPDEAWSPFQILEFWSEAWRREHDAEYGLRHTIETEANFLRYLLTWAWDHEPAWDDFAADVRRARLRLEDILAAGQRQDLTRVQCNNVHCERHPRLIRLVGDQGTTDTYKCPHCKARYDEDGYRRAYAAMLHSESADKYVRVQDAVATLVSQGRGLRTVRRWLAPPMEHVADRCALCRAEWPPQEYPACPRLVVVAGVREPCGGELRGRWRGDPNAVVGGYCDIGTHTTWVYWPDLWRRHLTTRRTNRASA